MQGLFLLIPVSIIFFVLAVVIFMWAVGSGQYEDLDGEGERLLFDDDGDNDNVGSKAGTEAEAGSDEKRAEGSGENSGQEQ